MAEFLRIAHCQYETHAGKFEENLAKFEAGLERADRERVQVVSFPECFLNGYPDTGELTRQVAFAVDSSEAMRVLDVSSRFEATAIVGFNEVRGPDLFNTAMVVHRGHLLGTYSKCMAYQPFHRQGRVFPVFERDGVKFGVVICADGGYYEPTRILALKGARIIFAPHFNYIAGPGVISHFMKVRADHTARAIENGVYFVRGNNVVNGLDPAITRTEGIGYGDSYVIDPGGEILARTRRHTEDFLMADLDTQNPNYDFRMKQARMCWHTLKSHFEEAMGAEGAS